MFQAVLAAASYSFLLAMGGFFIGVVVGLILAIVMQRFLFFERGLLPFVIASQTVPLIALAPLIVGIGNQISFGPIEWSTTYSVMFIAAYLAFFPLSIRRIARITGTGSNSLELMRSYAATNNSILWKLRFRPAFPTSYLPLKSLLQPRVVGTVVAEISTGVRGGIGRLMIEYARETTSPTSQGLCRCVRRDRTWLVVAAIIAAIDVLLTRNLPKKGLA